MQGPVCIGTCITLSDPAVTEALCNTVDFVWIDTEHNPLPLDKVQGHIMATKGTDTAPLVRMGEPWHADVLRAIDTVLTAGKKAGIPVGLGGGGEPEIFIDWANKGVRWLSIGADFWLLLRAMTQLNSRIREQVSGGPHGQ